jgi:spore germination cell wall hydrolase CwlJ-like protein
MLAAILCLAEVIYFESRNQPQAGQIAVGHVVMNRVLSQQYPDSPCHVTRQGRYWLHIPIKHKCQFSYYCDGLKETIRDKPAYGQAVINATAIYYRWIPDNTNGATHYHADYVQPSWAVKDPQTIINNHLFYRL